MLTTLLSVKTRDRREHTTATKYHKILKNVNILELHGHIWNRHEKYIRKSANMPSICPLIREIDIKIKKFQKANRLLLSITKARVLGVNRQIVGA